MHPRYPAPAAERIWSTSERANRMRRISDWYALDALHKELIPLQGISIARAQEAILTNDPVSLRKWEAGEGQSGHEIVGFLQAYLDRLPPEVHPLIHYGLTSSDLVEFDLHVAIAEHVGAILDRLQSLVSSLSIWESTSQDVKRAGRTHGQTAELTTLGHQFLVYEETALRLRTDLDQLFPNVSYLKTPGPVGKSPIRELPISGIGKIESFQIIPRDILMRWASVYLNLSQFLESLAMFIRLGARSEIGEFQEGSAKDRQGSSAMPGKRNPIDSEKVTGLARIVRGYHLALSEVGGSLWEERDLSNSSTERIAVPGLAATVEHMLTTMIDVIDNLVVNETRVLENTYSPATSANHRQNVNQRTLYVGPIEASKITKEEDEH